MITVLSTTTSKVSNCVLFLHSCDRLFCACFIDTITFIDFCTFAGPALKYRSYTFLYSLLGTASVTVAGLIAAGRLTGRDLADDKYLFVGAGEVSSNEWRIKL